ncbi:MAG: hypothetical protein JXK16_06930 [Thiotrichales bacterium]|nr:hypothetical protein [Thiotrichales bacterium]
MEFRNKQKDNNPMGGFVSVKVLSTGLPMAVLSAIYAALSFSVGSAV